MAKKDDLLKKLTDIGTCTDDATRRNLLLEMQAEVGNVCDENDRLTQANTTFEADNKQLREYNMKLFLSVGQPATHKKQDNNTETDTENLRYENLFNEKGELK